MATDPAEEEDEQWRFSLADLEESDDAEADGSERESNIAGELAPDAEIEACDIDPENALFVALGVVGTVAVLAGFVVFLP